MNSDSSLSRGLYILGALMRRWPRPIRKLDWWWEKAYRAIGGGGFDVDPAIEARWPGGLQRPVRGKLHPYLVRLNLKDWLERRAYFSGQLYQRDLERALTLLLKRGDSFVDVGANIGLVSLLAASRIGRTGRLIAVEANPSVFSRLKDHLQTNLPEEMYVALNVALGDRSSVAYLHVPQGHSGTGSLTIRGGTIEVPVEPADRVLELPDKNRAVFIKIDVEGYECRVLEGMKNLLSQPHVALIVEVTKDMLARIGDSPQLLHSMLRSAGFSSYLIRHRIGRWGEHVAFEPIEQALDEEQYDALYVKRGSIFEERISSRVSAARSS